MKPKIFIWQNKRTHKVQTRNYCIVGSSIEKERLSALRIKQEKKK